MHRQLPVEKGQPVKDSHRIPVDCVVDIAFYCFLLFSPDLTFHNKKNLTIFACYIIKDKFESLNITQYLKYKLKIDIEFNL